MKWPEPWDWVIMGWIFALCIIAVLLSVSR